MDSSRPMNQQVGDNGGRIIDGHPCRFERTKSCWMQQPRRGLCEQSVIAAGERLLVQLPNRVPEGGFGTCQGRHLNEFIAQQLEPVHGALEEREHRRSQHP